MIQLELTIKEGQHLKEEVTKRLNQLDHEIAHTDSTDFKDMLNAAGSLSGNSLRSYPEVPEQPVLPPPRSPELSGVTPEDTIRGRPSCAAQ